MKCVRLPLMSVADLLSVVRPAGLVKPDALLDAIAERTNIRLSSLPHRGQLSKNINQKIVFGEISIHTVSMLGKSVLNFKQFSGLLKM